MTQEDVADYLGPLLTDPSRIKREAVRRRKPFDEKSVSLDDIPDHEAKGWQVDRKLKRLTKVKREKEIDERLDISFLRSSSRISRYPDSREKLSPQPRANWAGSRSTAS
jgi:hypothetical protein